MSNIVTKKQSFWDKPEGLIGMIGAFAAAGGALWLLSIIVPIILKTFIGILGIMIVGGIIFTLTYLTLFDNPLRRALSLKYQVFCRNLHRMVVNQDPIAILRILQTKAKKRLEEFKDLMGPVAGARRSVDRAVETYTAQIEQLQAELNIHSRNNDSEQVERALVKMGKTQKYHEEMTKLAGDVSNMETMLNKAGKVVKQIIEDAEWEINNEEIRFGAVKNVNSAWKKLRSVFKASTDESDLRQEALRSVAEQCDARLGEVDTFINEFKEVLSVVGTQDAINAEKARAKMAALHQHQQKLAVQPLAHNPAPATSFNKPVQSKFYQPTLKR